MDTQIAGFLAVIQSALSGIAGSLSDPDWFKLIEMAKRHQVVPLFYEG